MKTIFFQELLANSSQKHIIHKPAIQGRMSNFMSFLYTCYCDIFEGLMKPKYTSNHVKRCCFCM